MPRVYSMRVALAGAPGTPSLKTLAGGPRHGYAIAKYIEDASGDTGSVEEVPSQQARVDPVTAFRNE
jgi:hypothetical protein